MTADTVAHYQLQERLGSGAMGEVWLADDLRLRRAVALKMLPAEAADDAAAAARLLREARVAAALTHPNVAVIYDMGEAEREGRRTCFIAMEYVKGRTLAEVLKDGRLEASALVPIAIQVALALAAAHEVGIVHRDVKPGNVMVSDRGLVKVLDFGLARFFPPDGEAAATWSGGHGPIEGMLAGTLAYMSPEQVRGGAVDPRSDVFSLGVVLYELLAGRRPFEGRNAVELIEAILRAEPPPLSAEGSLATGVARLVSGMLEKDPARRPASMREVVDELEGLAEGRAPSANVVREHTVAVMSFANVTGRAEDAWLGTGLAETIAAGLAGVETIIVLSREHVVEVLRALGIPPNSEDPAVVARVGRELGARSVVSGAYQCLGDQIRVTARVTESESGRVSLSPKVDGTRAGIFEVQDRIVAELATFLRGQRPSAPRAEETHSLEAYEAWSKGLVNLVAESVESLDRAILFFERAIALDPAFARAHMHLGAALDVKGDYLGVPALTERALASLDRALALRPECAETWRHRGSALITSGRGEEALAAFERALALNPMDASAHSGVGRVHFVLRGDFAPAVAAFERALALNPKAGWAALQLANCAAFLRDFPKAEGAARRAIELQEGLLSGRAGLVIVGGYVRLGQVFALQGRHGEALAEYERELEFLKSVDHALRGRIFIELHQRLGEARLRLGDDAGGRAALEMALEAFARRLRTGADDPATPYYAACAHALGGEEDAALTCLESAAAKRPRLTAARAPIEPALESLRGHPRFETLVSRASGGP